MASVRSGLLVLLLGLGVVGSLLALTPAAVAHAGPANAPANCSSGLSLTTSNTAGTAPLLVTFQLTSYYGDPITLSWNFGDGTYFNGTGAGALSPTHRYNDIGSYTAEVEVTAPGRSGACSIQIQVSPPPLAINVTATPSQGVAPLTVQLSGAVQGGTGTFTQVGWSFGNGQNAPGAVLTHTYPTPGVYYATFSVTDSVGDHSNATVAITVEAVQPTGNDGGGVATISLYGILAAFVALFAGAFLYVRAHPIRFHPSGSGTESDPTNGGPGPAAEAEVIASGAPLPPAEPSSTALVPLETRYRPEMYRGLFIDLSDQEFDVLTQPTEEEIRDAEPDSSGSALPRIPLSQRIILYLIGQPQLGPDDTATVAFTQAGMTDALGVQQGPLSNVLRRLTYSGILKGELGHVQGSSRRLNVYRLTPKGEIVAVKLRDAQKGLAAVDGTLAKK
jgi:PKD repeat protein